jgi:hypothetical protein
LRTHQWVLVVGRADEDPVVHPLRLYELELALQVGADGDEDDAAVFAVVLHHTVGKHRSVAGAAPDQAVQALDADDVGVAWIHAAGVRAYRHLRPRGTSAARCYRL